MTVKNAIYRCAGVRQTFDVANNVNSDGGLTPQSSDGTGLFTYDGNGYAWKTEVPASPTLGYVYVTAGSSRVPVYALAGYTLERELGWSASRVKVYHDPDHEAGFSRRRGCLLRLLERKRRRRPVVGCELSSGRFREPGCVLVCR